MASSWIECLNMLQQNVLPHYSDATWAPWRLKSLATRVFVQLFVQANIEKNIKIGPLLGESRWPMDSPHNWPVMRKTFPIYDVIVGYLN